jgi:two-component system cell cycle response regulator
MKKRKVLIVEDNIKNMKLFSALLQINNIEVLAAEDAERGLEILQEVVPDLILMDIQLPGMNGYEATRLIKKDPKLQDVPVVAFTAYAMQGDEDKAIEAGCDGYLSKPIESRPFIEKIESFFNQNTDGQKDSSKRASSHKKKILIVDDDQTNRRLLEKMLSAERFDVIFAKDGQEGMDKVYEESPDVILLDVMMPKKDGFTVARELKKDLSVKNIPIILITALDGSDNRITGLEAGAEEFLTKPVKKVELIARIRSMLKLKEYREQLSIRKQTEALFTQDAHKETSKTLELDRAPHVLLVEDNEIDRNIILKALLNEPLRMETVKNGVEAICSIQNGGVDLILLDILLPDINGFEICKRIKTMDMAKDIPIIVITCLDDMDSKITGFNLGADDFLVKPIETRELKARIKVHLEKKDQLDKLRTHYENALSSASIDALTGLYNHGYFKKFLGLEIKRSDRQMYPVSLLMIDIDEFKLFNDTFGHLKGDEILQKIGTLIRSVIREVDLTARYGGDEFVVILPYSDKSGAVKVSNRIQNAISSYDAFKEFSQDMDELTVSIGVAEFPYDCVDDVDMIRKADHMLYLAKQKGKNQICYFRRDFSDDDEKIAAEYLAE